ncbi:YtxH domain-containing protein [Pollutibacter soli]|uniref:YtxH domain-containing protein n=1 Tax=Pollutibacter soli TaxID=3034157 RepID=UPI003013E448
MSENPTKQPATDGTEKIQAEESFTDRLTTSAGNLAEKAGDAWEKVSDKAEDTWEKLEDKAEELWDKAKNSELYADAKDKLEDLKDGAQKLWDKVVDRFDGNDEEKPKQA